MPNSALGPVERVVRVIAVFGCVWLGFGGAAQPAEVPSEPPADSPSVVDMSSSASDPRIGFSFKDAPFDQVLDFFARESGVPIIFESDPPVGTLTFVSGVEYDLKDAIGVLNLMLRRHDRYLRHEGDFLYLSSLPEAAKHAGESFEMELPSDVTPDQIVTVTIPLSNANAALVAEQLKPLLDSFGSVTAVPEQNIVIIVETAAQIERLSRVIQTIDERRPVDSSYRLFPLKHAQAEAVVQALKGLVGQRVQRIIIDKDGQQRVVEDIDVGGLNIEPDARTNSVIVVGPQGRIETVQELILLLDASGDGSGDDRRLATFTLRSVSPAKAQQQVAALFSGQEESHRPTLVPLEETNKLAIVGTDSAIVQAKALLDELDPSPADGVEPDEEAVVVPLHYLSADSAQTLLSRLMTPRHQRMIRSVKGGDNRSLVVVGPSSEVAGFVSLISGIDRPASQSREVRLVRLAAADPKRVFDEASRLFDASNGSAEDLDRSLDETSGTVTLIGTRASVDRFVGVLTDADQLVRVSTESRTYDVAEGAAEELSARLTRVLGVILPGPGARPTVRALPELDQIVVQAEPMQFGLVEGVIDQLSSHASVELEVIRLHSSDPSALIQRAQELASAQFPDGVAAEVQYDEASGSLIVSGTKSSVSAFRGGLERAQLLMPPSRTTQFLDVSRANAADLVEPLRAFLASADPIDPGRAVPPASISVVERTNSLMVVAEPAQHALIRDYVRRLDVIEQTDLPPLRLLQLRTADAKSIAAMLTDQYRQRPQSERTAKPVEVRADDATNTLIVAAHPELFEDIKSFVDELNRDRSDGPERVTRLFPLRVARAVDVAQAMDRLYPEPPVPLDRRGRPMPWLREPKQVTVSAEPNSNSLIFDAPADRIESLTELAEQLDRVEVPVAAELRTYRVVNADLSVVAGALKGLAQRGVLSAPATAGRQAVQVLIETEPMSKTLIVAGDSVTFDKVEQMLKDLSAVPVQREVRIVPIVGQLASEVANRSKQIYEVQTASMPDAKPVDVTVDERTNALELVGEKESMARFLAVLDELQSQTGPAMQIRLVELRAAKAGAVTQFLEELTVSSAAMGHHGGPVPTYEAIESTNSILIAATPDDWAIIQPLIDSLDTAEGQVRPPLRLFRMRSTDAENIASILQQSFDRRPSADRVRMPVDIRADASTNTLIVAAHEAVLPEIEGILSDLNDARALDDSGRRIQIFPLRVARAADLARTIDQMYPEPPMPKDSRGRPRPDLRQPKEIVVRADAATNSLIVDAPSARLAGFEQLVRELDRAQVAEDVEVRTYRVHRAELADVQRTLQELADRNALGASGQASVTISSEGRGRTLVISGPAEIFGSVEQVIQSLDSPPDTPTRVLRLYKLEYARADQLAPMLRETLSDQAREILGSAEDETREVLNISSDGGSNTLIISAPEPIQDIARELVEALDTEASARSRSVVRVVSLAYADAASIAPTLVAASGAMDLTGPTPPTVVAVGGVNALLISGSADGVDRVAELVSSLDTRPVDVEAPGVETFELQHASARDIAQTVERMLVNQLETDPRVVAMRLRYARDRALPAPTVRVEADERTNSLIVSAPQATLELARAIVTRLDQPIDSAGVTMTYMPTRARAASLTDAVEQILSRTESDTAKGAELFLEPTSQAIVVTGPEEAVGRAVKLLSEFDDRAMAAPESTLRVIELENADAAGTASTLTRVLTDRSRWPEQLRRAVETGLPVSDPVFTPNSESNTILMISPTALVPLATELVASLDRTPANHAVETRVFHLQQGQAASVAPAVLQALHATASANEPETTVTAERVSNSILVVGPPGRVAQAEQLVGELDGATDTDGIGVRTVKLRHARAEALAPIVQSIVQRQSEADLMPSWMLGTYLARGGQVRQRAQVVAEPRLNALIVSGPVGVLDLVEQVVAELDVQPQSTEEERPVRVLVIRNAEASALAETISDVFTGASVAEVPPVVRVDTQSNSLVIRANAEQYARIKEIVDELDDAAMASGRQYRRISVDPSRLDAGQMAELLRDVLEQQNGARVEVMTIDELTDPGETSGESGAMRGPVSPSVSPMEAIVAAVLAQPGDLSVKAEPESEPDRPKETMPAEPEVRITVDPATNTLLVTGSVRMTDRIAELAAEFERLAPAERTRARVVRLPDHVDPNLISQILTRTERQIGRRSESNPGGFTGMVASAADRAGGNVIVWANDTDFESIGPMIAALSRDETGSARLVKVYPLHSIRASRAIQAVRDFVSPTPNGRQARRLRASRVMIDGPDGSTMETTLEPSRISISVGPGDASLIVTAPGDAIAAIDRFVSVIDQNPSEQRMAIRQYVLKHSDARAMSQVLSRMFNARRQQNPDMPRPAIAPLASGNMLLVTATTEQHNELLGLLPELDSEPLAEGARLEIFHLEHARASGVQRAIRELLLSQDPGRAKRVTISADDSTGVVIFRGAPEDADAVREIIAGLDSPDTKDLPVRTLVVERADAVSVAAAISSFIAERDAASQGSGRRGGPSAAITADRRSGSIVVAADDADYEIIRSLVERFDAPKESRDLVYRVLRLEHARASQLKSTLEDLVSEMQYERMYSRNKVDNATDGRVYIQTDDRLNAVIVLASPQRIESIERIISDLDLPTEAGGLHVMRAVALKHADATTVARVIAESTQSPDWPWWRGRDPQAVIAEVDRSRNMLLLVGDKERVEMAVQFAEQIESSSDTNGGEVTTIRLTHARADRAARAIDRFFQRRARTNGLDASEVAAIGSPDGNVLIVSANKEDTKLVSQLVQEIDKPELGDDREIEVYVLRNADVAQTARSVSAMFPSRGAPPEERVIVTPQAQTNSLLVSAPKRLHDSVGALVEELDRPPSEADNRIVTVSLESARASAVAQSLREALPASVKIKITLVDRSNSLLLTGSDEAIELVMRRIEELDAKPIRNLMEFKRIRLVHAEAFDVWSTLKQILRGRDPGAGPVPTIDYESKTNTLAISASADQIQELMTIVKELDVPPEVARRTEFVSLEYADAEQVADALLVFYGPRSVAAATPGARGVTIVPDKASGSLVISADVTEWDGILALLAKLDTEQYDTSRQLAVLKLEYADASSVASALDEGFRDTLDSRVRREQARSQNQKPVNQNGQGAAPPVLIRDEDLPTVSAEMETNSLVVFAGRRDLDRIRSIVEQIDRAEFVEYPQARILPIRSGRPSKIAETVRTLYAQRNSGKKHDRRTVLIVGDDSSRMLIVRADEKTFVQIQALADAVQEQADLSGIRVRILSLHNSPAARIRSALEQTFQQTADFRGESLSIQVDRDNNALVIASTESMFEEIRRVADELDRPHTIEPGADEGGKGTVFGGVQIVDVTNNDPASIIAMLRAIGVSRPVNTDQPGLVGDPVQLVALASRRAIAISGAPADVAVVAGLIPLLDQQAIEPSQTAAVLSLDVADASAVAATLTELLSPRDGSAGASPAVAAAEHLRRLSLSRGVDAPLELDLSVPIRIIPDGQTNSILVASTESNVSSVRELVRMLDQLPVGDAVMIRIFPLNNAAADRTKAILNDLFRQGDVISRAPGTDRSRLPSTAAGHALISNIAISVDERTNSLIVAGREESVALVEVLIKDLDTDQASNWVEPTIIRLQHADPRDLADQLNRVLVDGLAETPESRSLQRQAGRLRLAAEGGQGEQLLQADLFTPIGTLVILPEPNLQSLLVLGSPSNIDVVRGLASMLDVEAAAASNGVRLFPLVHAAADRVAGVVTDLFRERETLPGFRAEDKLILSVDTRTNTLIVSTSPSSFAVLDSLLESLDTADPNFAIGLHVLPIHGGDAAQLAPKIERLMRERISATQRSGSVESPMDTFTIESEPGTNSLIIAASDENLQLVRELVEMLTGDEAQQLARGMTVEVIALSSTRPTDAAQAVTEFYIDPENERRGPGSVAVIANARLNALVVRGTDDDVKAIRELVAQFDTASPTATQDVQRIELSTANAFEVVQLLNSVLSGRTISGPRSRSGQAVKLRFLRDQMVEHIGQDHDAAEAEIDSVIREQVSITPELRTNSVLVVAPPEVMKFIESMIADLDTTTAGTRQIEKFRLENADARAMARVLQDLFSLRQDGRGRLYLVPSGAVGSASSEAGDDENQDGLAGQGLTPVPDDRQQLAITIDARTNTLIVSATQEYLDLVRGVVRDLDSIVATEREQIVVDLQYAQAQTVQATLQQYFEQESQRIRQVVAPGQSGSLTRQLEQEVTIIGDPKSQKVLISASPRYIETVKDIVRELDAAPPQVVIQVLLAEVTLDDSDQWGISANGFQVGGDNYDIGYLGAGASLATALGVPNLSVSSTDFSLLVRALQAQGKLEILSNPRLTVNNNEQASIQVGENVALPADVETLTDGRTRASVRREDVGVLLSVTPSISSDGFVRLDVQPEISVVTERTTQITEDFEAPIISTRRVDTTVTVRDGQTVVIGGLIQTTKQDQHTKVPLLGDIPILGIPFRSHDVKNVRTELLMILTPTVIPGGSATGTQMLDQDTQHYIDGFVNPESVRDILERYRMPRDTDESESLMYGPPSQE